MSALSLIKMLQVVDHKSSPAEYLLNILNNLCMIDDTTKRQIKVEGKYYDYDKFKGIILKFYKIYSYFFKSPHATITYFFTTI